MKPILVTCYTHPDLDGVAGAVAYAEFLNKTGKSAVAGVFGNPHEEAKYVLERFDLAGPKSLSDDSSYETVILIDASDLMGFENKLRPEKVIEIIDHRQIHEAEKFINAKAQIDLVGAAATLVAERYITGGIEISRDSAILLLSAIISNTLNFKASVTTERDRNAAAWLNQTAKLLESYWEELFLAKSDLSGDKLVREMNGHLAYFDWSGHKVGIAQIEIIGAEKLLTERKAEIVSLINEDIKKGFEVYFLNAIELKDDKTFLITPNVLTQELLSKALKVSFNDVQAELPYLIMRKQIIPLVKKELEEKI